MQEAWPSTRPHTQGAVAESPCYRGHSDGWEASEFLGGEATEEPEDPSLYSERDVLNTAVVNPAELGPHLNLTGPLWQRCRLYCREFMDSWNLRTGEGALVFILPKTLGHKENTPERS